MVDTFYKKIIEMLNTGIVILEKDGCVVSWNPWMAERSGISEEKIIGLPLLEVLPELQNTRIARAIHKALDLNCPSVLSAKLIDASFPLYKDKITSKRNPPRLVQSIQIKPFFQEEEGQHCVISVFDISSADLREKALRTQSVSLSKLVGDLQDKDYELQTLFQNTQNSIVIFDDSGKVLNANPATLATLGYGKKELLDSYIYDLIDELTQADFANPKDPEPLLLKLPITGGEIEMTAKTKHQVSLSISVSANVIPYENQPTRYFVFFRDITEKKKSEAKLNQMARYDNLTKLPNRFSFLEILEHTIHQHHRITDQFSLFFVDLDRFKSINDSFGHQAGDEVLQQAADRLSFSCRSSDVVARWAGDEFVMLLANHSKSRSAITVAEKIMTSFGEPLVLSDGKEVQLHCSIGISRFPGDGKDADALITKADQAMYQAKSEGPGVFRFFTPEMNELMQRRLRMEDMLRTAIKEHQFVLHYQPQVNVYSGEMTGVEALIRWHHPTEGLIMPDSFIRIAEECGLISAIGDWVMADALETAASWYQQVGYPLKMAINISPKQLTDEGLVSRLKKLLDSVGVPPSSLVLEITEGYLMSKSKTNLVTLNALKSLGVQIAIDDFGTGYSSLSYLRRLPIDIIKIDREFLSDAADNPTSAHIVSAIIELAHALSLDVVAEGVECVSQLELLRHQGCDHAQGFYLGRPMDLDHLNKWYQEQSRSEKSVH